LKAKGCFVRIVLKRDGPTDEQKYGLGIDSETSWWSWVRRSTRIRGLLDWDQGRMCGCGVAFVAGKRVL